MSSSPSALGRSQSESALKLGQSYPSKKSYGHDDLALEEESDQVNLAQPSSSLQTSSGSKLPSSQSSRSVKRQKTDQSASSPRTTQRSRIASSLSPRKTPLNLMEVSDNCSQVIWVDIASKPEEVFWWPGLIPASTCLAQLKPESDVPVKLLSESKANHLSTGSKPLNSFKAHKPFAAHLNFSPSQMNPILLARNCSSSSLTSRYPSAKSLVKAYREACEKHVIYSFQQEDDLPDLSTCMIPLSQENRAVLEGVWSQEPKSSHSSPDSEERLEHLSPLDEAFEDLDPTLDEPDDDLQIPGETVLSRTKAKGEYWPARVLKYVGLRAPPRPGRQSKPPAKQKYYQLEFFDGKEMELMRSFFLTSDQEAFHQVPIGQIRTVDVSFESILPDINKQIHHLDVVIQGKSINETIIAKHDKFLGNKKQRGSIPEDVKYGKYSEEVIQRVGEFLKGRYITQNDPPNHITPDERFTNLPESEQIQYIYDVLVPELIWLITVQQYYRDAQTELPVDSSFELIWEHACKLALNDIQEVDVVDKVIGLRVWRKTSGDDDSQTNKHKKRTTVNSSRSKPRSP